MDLGLTGSLALVSGSSRGIGRAIAIALAREGARVAAVARGEEGLTALLAELPPVAAGAHVAVAADVATAAGADRAVAESVRALGGAGLDVVIANVGKSFARTVADMDDDDLQRSIDLNLGAAARVAQRAVPHLKARGGGSITMTSSIYGRESGGAPGYNVAKAGVIALAKAMARDLAANRIRVNSIAPGSILFPGGGWDKRQKDNPDAIAAMVQREIPSGRFGTPEEVADVVTFIASPRASWITGACIVVDGGQSRAF